MTDLLTTAAQSAPFPDHTQLPESDGTFVKNFQEHPQSILLTDSIGPILQQIHPDGQYAIGQDCGIYWRQTDPPEKGAEPPDCLSKSGEAVAVLVGFTGELITNGARDSSARAAREAREAREAASDRSQRTRDRGTRPGAVKTTAVGRKASFYQG